VLAVFWALRHHVAEARSWIGQLLPTADSLDSGLSRQEAVAVAHDDRRSAGTRAA
jgi:hypothetical protein